MGIYVGRSPAHASKVALILNPRSGHISPQFHVVYDDDFTTVPYLRTGKVPPHWEGDIYVATNVVPAKFVNLYGPIPICHFHPKSSDIVFL